ncbi:DedA family protein [Candidatus Gottesmanbacteria bacterium]|nr:DedA family protein [Candidatus Gottesmanbacteria bacterium]
MLELLGAGIIHFISSAGYGGIFLLMTAESALIPIPSEVTMPFSGSLVALGTFNIWFVVIAGTLGNLFGSLLAYALGWWGQEAVVRKLIVKYGKYLLITEHEYDRAERWFRSRGEAIVFVSRVLPIVRTFISLPAGVAKMNLTRFTIYTTVGSFLWSLFLTYIGVVLGNNWKSLERYFHKFDLIIVSGLVVLAAWYLRRKFKFFTK